MGKIRTFVKTAQNAAFDFWEGLQTTFSGIKTSIWIPKTTDTNANAAIKPKGNGANVAQDPDGTVAGGNARGEYATDWQKIRAFNTQVASGNYSTIGGGQNNTASGNRAIVGGGLGNTAAGVHATVNGGNTNVASGTESFVGSGVSNTASNNRATVAGGENNTASAPKSTIGGGQNNISSGEQSTVGGGLNNTASGQRSFVGGGQDNTASGTHATVNGGDSNTASGDFSPTVGGGINNTASDNNATVSGGNTNTASGSRSTVGGGQLNTSTANYSTIGGGRDNNASNVDTTIGGGRACQATGDSSVNSGGYFNLSTNTYSTVGGGRENRSNGARSTVSGGQNNTADGDYSSIVGGNRASAYSYGQSALASGRFAASGDAQVSQLISRREADLTTGGTTTLHLDGSSINFAFDTANKAANILAEWIAVVESITGTATGVSVGDVIAQDDLFLLKEVGGVMSIVGSVTNTATKNDTSQATASMGYSTGGTELDITFTGATFSGGGTLTYRIVHRIIMVEVGF